MCAPRTYLPYISRSQSAVTVCRFEPPMLSFSHIEHCFANLSKANRIQAQTNRFRQALMECRTSGQIRDQAAWTHGIQTVAHSSVQLRGAPPLHSSPFPPQQMPLTSSAVQSVWLANSSARGSQAAVLT